RPRRAALAAGRLPWRTSRELADACRFDGPGSPGADSHPPPPRVGKSANSLHRRQPAFDHVGKRRLSTKDAVGIGPLHPSVGELLGVENVERLEDADEIGDAR